MTLPQLEPSAHAPWVRKVKKGHSMSANSTTVILCTLFFLDKPARGRGAGAAWRFAATARSRPRIERGPSASALSGRGNSVTEFNGNSKNMQQNSMSGKAKKSIIFHAIESLGSLLALAHGQDIGSPIRRPDVRCHVRCLGVGIRPALSLKRVGSRPGVHF